MRSPAIVLLTLLSLAATMPLPAQLTFLPAEPAEDLMGRALPGEGVTIQKVTFKGSEAAVARYKVEQGAPLFADGIILSTGKARDAAGPNDQSKTSTSLGVAGDYRADDLGNNRSFDASVATILFTPEKDSISIGFIFASEEYNEGVNNTFNDLFLIELTGVGQGQGNNLGTLPGTQTPIGIRSVNIGENRKYYVDNNPYKLNGERDPALESKLDRNLLKAIEYDGLTKPLHAGARVKPGAQYTLRIMIADLGDGNFDSALLIESFSLVSLEQHKHEVRRQKIAEQRRLDSLHIVDSLATVERLRQEELAQIQKENEAKALAALAYADSLRNISAPIMPTTSALEERFVFKADEQSLAHDQSQWHDLDKIADKLKSNAGLRVSLFAPDMQANQLAAMHVTVVRSYLRGKGVPEAQILSGDASFAEEGEQLPAERVEVWVK